MSNEGGRGCGVSPPHDEVPSTSLPSASLRYAQDRLFCFGKRTQNHWRPGVALRVPLPRPRLFGLPSTSGALRLTLRMNGLSLPVHASLPFVLSVALAKSKGAQTVLAPTSHLRDRGAATPGGAGILRHGMPALLWLVMPGSIGHPGSLGLSVAVWGRNPAEKKDAGSPKWAWPDA